MSRVPFEEDYFNEKEALDMSDSFSQLTRDLDEIDIPDNLNLENPELMSSEFFDSVLSLEEPVSFEYGSDNVSSSNIDSDIGLHSEIEEWRLNYNGSPDSASSGFSYGIPDDITTNNNIDSEDNGSLSLLKKPEVIKAKLNAPSLQDPGKIIVNNPNGKKVILTKPYVKTNRRFVPNAKHIYKVQSISGKGRTLFLPFDVTKMKNVKFIKGSEFCAENLHIMKPSTASVLKSDDNYSISSPDSVDDDSDSTDTKTPRQYPVLILTDEEKRMLSKDGIRLPTRYPLSKNEEKELKRIRRKIRNKISAQDSRKRKKEYVDGLEERLKKSADEKKILMNRVKALQQQNNRLVSQMHKLQSLVFNTNKATPTTCLLIVLMSVLLISLPNLNISKGRSPKDEQRPIARRTLLSRATTEDSGSLEEFLLFNAEQKSKKSSAFEEIVADEHDGRSYVYYDDCEISHKKSFLERDDIVKDVRNTVDKMKDFFKNQFALGNNYSDGKIIEKREVPRNIQKRIHYCSDSYDDYVPPKISKMGETEAYITSELNSVRDSPSSVALHLSKRE